MPTSKFIVSELGRERQCPKCLEFWPYDLEFWFSNGKRLSSWCKACYEEWKKERKLNKDAETQNAKLAA